MAGYFIPAFFYCYFSYGSEYSQTQIPPTPRAA
ncbi:hypothetical protein CGLO_17177 [Colletotrichum gloeosporioides Cg-14]|uniref:Uncharacterized protein n=1 Tax=Colletotrichum gloeosporioides (strain Cg-14) TaxID=1237896 RepID=T0KXE2_COLGC|nr:hypothetical protein CGLO_17177 [Colletotrichum gloeosporioides Cg-14]